MLLKYLRISYPICSVQAVVEMYNGFTAGLFELLTSGNGTSVHVIHKPLTLNAASHA